MKIQDKISILRYLFNLLNGISLLCGLLLLGCGSWILFDQNNILTALVSTDVEDPRIIGLSYGLLALGAAISLISLLGLLGSLREIRCLLILYMTFHILVCVAQIAVQLVLFTLQGEILAVLNERFDIVITEYGNPSLLHKEHQWKLLDTIQKSFRCCGKSNSSDWEINRNNLSDHLPCSCTNSSQEKGFCKTSDYDIYPKGCGIDLTEWFSSNIFVINGIGICAVVIQIFQFTLAVTLFKNIGKKNKIVQEP